MLIKNEDIRSIHDALVSLSQKRLGDRESENRVAALIRRFKKARREINIRHNGIIVAHPCPDGWEEEKPPILVFEARTKEYNDLMEETQELRDIPANLYITEKDLPKLIKGEAGDDNRLATSAIMEGLGFLYRTSFDEPEPVVDGQDGTNPEE